MKLDNVFCIELLSHHRPKEQMAGVTDDCPSFIFKRQMRWGRIISYLGHG